VSALLKPAGARAIELGASVQFPVNHPPLLVGKGSVEAFKKPKPIQPFIHRHAADLSDNLFSKKRPQPIELAVIFVVLDPGIPEVSLDSVLQLCRSAVIGFPVKHQVREPLDNRFIRNGTNPSSELIQIHRCPQAVKNDSVLAPSHKFRENTSLKALLDLREGSVPPLHRAQKADMF
jgi:hypothetical protein